MTENKKNRLLIIDADILLYKASTSAEQSVSINTLDTVEATAMKNIIVDNFITGLQGDNITILWSDFSDALTAMKLQIQRLKDQLKASKLVFALSDSNNFRKEVLPTYKGNRVATRKPICYAQLKDYLIKEYETVVYPNLEGDDVLGILATDKDYEPGYQKVMVSIDKDLLQIPDSYIFSDMRIADGGLATWEESIQYISPAEGLYKHLEQTLAGDVTDGYKGCPKVGPKGVEKLLEAFICPEHNYLSTPLTTEEAWHRVEVEFNKKGVSREEMLQQARVAKILTNEDWNKDKQEVLLFKPPVITIEE